MTCRVCGCDARNACVAVHGDIMYTCWWAEEDLCVFCLFDMPGEGRVPVRGVDQVLAVGGIL